MIAFSILALVAVLALIYTTAAKDKRTMAKLADVQASLVTLQATTDAVKAYAQQQAAPAATEADLDGIKAAIDARNTDLQAILPAAAPPEMPAPGAENGASAADPNAAGNGL